MQQKSVEIIAGYRVFYGADYLFYSIKSIYHYVDKIVIAISKKPHAFKPFCRHKPDVTKELMRSYPDVDNKLDIIEGNWTGTLLKRNPRKVETEHANALLDYVRSEYPQAKYFLILDSDEIFPEESISKIIDILESNTEFDALRVTYKNYWKGFCYFIEESPVPYTNIAVRIEPDLYFTDIRNISKDKIITLPDDVYFLHPAYVKSTRHIKLKMSIFGHSREIRKDWFDKVWKEWDNNRNIQNMHPLFDGLWWKRTIKIKKEQVPIILHSHPYFPYDTADDYEKKARKIKSEKDWQSIFIPEMISKFK